MINKVVIIGRLTADIEVQKTNSGKSVAHFTIACERPKRKDQEKQTDFIRCVAWEKTADMLAQYARKGTFLGIDGMLTVNNYTVQNGEKRSTTEVLTNTIQLIGGTAQQTHQAPQQMQMNPTEQNWSTPQVPQTTMYTKDADKDLDFTGYEINEDDLPF